MDQKRLRSAATEYPYLRGLLAIPVGLLLIVSALGNWQWGPLRHDWVFVLAVVVIALVVALINRYYTQHYGRVTPSARQRLHFATAAGLGIMVVGSLLLRSQADWSLDLPVNAIAVGVGLLMLISYAAVVGLKAHHLLIWGSLVVAGLLPVWNGDDPSNAGLVLAGVAFMVNGALDHLRLVRILGPSTTPTFDSEHAGR